jgi:ectoine hydroxylase-related dioxygenase (phytanoyl-CoA dioxygenase family)
MSIMSVQGSYGVVEKTDTSANQLDAIVEAISYRGVAVVPGAISDELVIRLNDRLDAVYVEQCDEVGGEATLLELADADIVRCPLAYDPEFLTLARHPVIVEVAQRVIGPSFVLLMQNGIINRPDREQAQTRWHRDLNYQHWVCSRPLAISALVCLEDFNRTTGGTVFLPGSHKFPQMPSDEIINLSETVVEAPKGSILLFDAMVFHRAGSNRSGRIRRGINHVIGAPILGQQIDIPQMLGGKVPTEPWVAGYLGFRWNPVPDVRTWRIQKLEQLRARRRDVAGVSE